MEFLTFVGVLVLLFWVSSLSGRIKRLEGGLGNKWSAPDSLRVSEPVSPVRTAGEVQKPASLLQANVPVDDWSNKFVTWIKEDWLMKLGALLLLIGFGWFATYAFLNNWIGPMGRIMLGVVVGTLILILGLWRIQKFLYQGGVFLVLGSTTILLTIFAAREIYGFFTSLSALGIMFFSTAFVAYASVKYNSKSLSLASLILAGAAPLFTNSPTTDYIGLFSYLLVVILGAIWIVSITGQRELTAAALILVSIYSAPHLFGITSADKGVLLLFAYAFAAIFFLTNTAGLLKLKGKDIVPDLVVAAGNGLFLLVWIMSSAQDEWKSLIIAAWMVVFSVGAFLIFKITERREPFYTYAGIGVAMLAAATSAELEGATLTIAYTLECGIVSLLVYYLLRDIRIALRMSILLAGPMLLAFGSMTSRAWMTSAVNDDFFVLLILASVLTGLGYFFFFRIKDPAETEELQFSSALLILGSVYAYVLLWLSLHAALIKNYDLATMISLVIYTLIGLIAYFFGMKHGWRTLRFYGGILLGFVVGRMILIEVWNMELTGRIITFFIIGTLLVSTAFLGRKKEVPKEVKRENPDNFTI
ncbi:MAG: hypothetical protein UW30_C0015G0005 [Candidatus Giovannonibacteria bacterium GW2011_GWA2_44_13b]|uniref:DUF2339 domain-containing protein n=2 Tax=Candidatus Giovannoniibacteriota TaxID=1752738 RepID=A0A0G1JZM0_9BACT|nr:MAG: hypothetical protein UW30_C0015G0005 [Candidatus Giovannonibacteria bacterium GW2011_GWA2_44_13b]OGF82443.1 MAG: hypothetical protein A2924_01140 [Candidatus Giovannonibacteria bacterium RIFCSPLOWO2_01_FULL_44_16]